jgi:hypothetical protein
MNLKRRLAELETGTAQSGDLAGLVRDHIDVLLPLFVATELVWWPFRASLRSGKTAVAIHERRRQHLAGGLPWSGPGGNSTNWKRSERQRAAMVAAGLVTMASRRGVPLVRLTDSALSIIRGLVGLPQLDRRAKLVRVAAAVLFDEANVLCRRGGWVSEVLLSGRSYTDWPATSNWYEFETMVLPLLICGAMESTSSTIGHVYYRLTDIEPMYIAGPDIEVDEAIKDRYLDLWSLASRADWIPEDTTENWIPLPATR